MLAEQILFGNGSNELIVFLSHLYLEPGRSLVMSEHAFAVYALATKLYQGELNSGSYEKFDS